MPEPAPPSPSARAAPVAAAVGAVALLALALSWVSPPGALGLIVGAALGAAVAVPLARRAAAQRTAADAQAAARPLAARIADLEAQVRRLHDDLDAIDEPVLATGADTLVTACNRAAATLLGLRPEGLLGRHVEEVFTQDDLLALHRAAREGASPRRQLRLGGPQGARTFEVAAIPVAVGAAAPPDAPRGVVMTFRDVTETARALQVRTDFVANASHELRTPVAALKIAAETLAGDARDDPAMRERLVGMIQSQVARLDELVRDLLDLSRLESPDVGLQIEPVPASELAATLRTMFESALNERRLTLRIDFAPELEALETDRNLLTVILKNLVENATKFAYEGTEIRLTGRPTPPALPASPQTGPHRGVRFEVIDQGVGIPLDQQSRIFERYYQVDEARTGSLPRRGSGLGLAIVKHAARTLGGTVRVSSVWKQGTTMTVDLPACLPPADQSSGR